jgi:hypothetical protein
VYRAVLKGSDTNGTDYISCVGSVLISRVFSLYADEYEGYYNKNKEYNDYKEKKYEHHGGYKHNKDYNYYKEDEYDK